MSRRLTDILSTSVLVAGRENGTKVNTTKHAGQPQYIGRPSSHFLISIISSLPSGVPSRTPSGVETPPQLILPLSLLLPVPSPKRPRLPIHSQTRLTSPPLPSRTDARTFAFRSTTAATRAHRFSRRLDENSSLNTSSRSCPTLIQASEAPPLACNAACVANRSKVVATNKGTRALELCKEST